MKTEQILELKAGIEQIAQNPHLTGVVSYLLANFHTQIATIAENVEIERQKLLEKHGLKGLERAPIGQVEAFSQDFDQILQSEVDTIKPLGKIVPLSALFKQEVSIATMNALDDIIKKDVSDEEIVAMLEKLDREPIQDDTKSER